MSININLILENLLKKSSKMFTRIICFSCIMVSTNVLADSPAFSIKLPLKISEKITVKELSNDKISIKVNDSGEEKIIDKIDGITIKDVSKKIKKEVNASYVLKSSGINIEKYKKEETDKIILQTKNVSAPFLNTLIKLNPKGVNQVFGVILINGEKFDIPLNNSLQEIPSEMPVFFVGTEDLVIDLSENINNKSEIQTNVGMKNE